MSNAIVQVIRYPRMTKIVPFVGVSVVETPSSTYDILCTVDGTRHTVVAKLLGNGDYVPVPTLAPSIVSIRAIDGTKFQLMAKKYPNGDYVPVLVATEEDTVSPLVICPSDNSYHFPFIGKFGNGDYQLRLQKIV